MLRLRRAAQQMPLSSKPVRHGRRMLTPARVAAAVVVAGMVIAIGASRTSPASGATAPRAAGPAWSATSAATAFPGPSAAPAALPAQGSPAAAPATPATPAEQRSNTAAALPATLPRAGDPGPTPTPTASPPISDGTLTPVVASALTARLARLRTQYGIPGIQATIIFADGRSWRAHAGFQNYGARTPVQNATPFPVASVTKTFIAALVVQLAQEGRFGLDDPLVSHLPGTPFDPRVTIRQLLDHTSGIGDFFANASIDAAILGCPTCAWTPARSLSFVKKQLFAPGTGWSYSNTNYVLLGQLVEAVTGQTYAALLRQRFFEPLGLISTYVQGSEEAPYPVVHSYRFLSSSRTARPTPLWDGTGLSPFSSLVTAAGSAGDIASSARDLAIWARALYGGRVLGAEGSNAMLDFGASVLLQASTPYGLGVEQFTVAGRVAYGHGGRLLGARSAIRYLPAEGISIAVVINTDRGDPATIADALATVALPPLVAPPPVTSQPTPVPVGAAPWR